MACIDPCTTYQNVQCRGFVWLSFLVATVPVIYSSTYRLLGDIRKTKHVVVQQEGLFQKVYQITKYFQLRESGTHCYIGRTQEEFGDVTIALLKSQPLRRKIGISGAQRIRTKYSIKKVGEEVFQHYKMILNARKSISLKKRHKVDNAHNLL